ncbi:MAG: AlpA family phage regulatory protein [Hydrogenophaga sp.]|nr:AlpA family phage regulatory protein [Hydrogenophaga sp.]
MSKQEHTDVNASAPAAPTTMVSPTVAAPPRLLRMAVVEERTGLKKSSIYAAIRAGTFPAAVRLGKQAVAWHESSVNEWIASRGAA